jgi:hypothetical protein
MKILKASCFLDGFRKISLIIAFGMMILGCSPVKVEDSDYVPASLEEQFVFSNSWCGYDFMHFDGMADNTKVNTLFKLDPNEDGMFYISMATQSTQINIQDKFSALCDFLDPNTLRCSGLNVSYVLHDSALSTNLLTILIPELSLTKLNTCTKQQLSNF